MAAESNPEPLAPQAMNITTTALLRLGFVQKNRIIISAYLPLGPTK